jgi:CRISPR-associated protein (TIGR02710 family)
VAKRVLILTVGGSPAPVVRAIQEHAPDHTYFICTTGKDGSDRVVDGQGPVSDGQSCIAAQTGLTTERYTKIEIPSAEVDALGACYNAACRAFDLALGTADRTEIVVDYTGGSKTMSSALVRAATGRYVASVARLSVVTGPRDKLTTVINGLESVRGQDAGTMRFDEERHQALALADDYHYAAAERLARSLLARTLPTAQHTQADALRLCCLGFDAWDRFDHHMARDCLRPVAARLPGPVMRDIQALCEAAVTDYLPATWGVSSLTAVHDLLFNADRRASQGRADDAVARLYRALEMLSQARLKGTFGIETGRIDPALVTEWLAGNPGRSADDPLRSGLREDYAILASKGDPLGNLFEAEGKPLLDMLGRRNASILAHGSRPIPTAEYESFAAPVRTFPARAAEVTSIKMAAPRQFPKLGSVLVGS